MRSSRIKSLAALLMLAVSASGAGAFAASPADIAAQRQEILSGMLTEEYDAAWIAGLRRLCAVGGEPDSVARSRAQGTYFTPDAADGCVTALVRTAHDRRLPELYGKLLAELGGSTRPEGLPKAIGAAVTNGTGKVAIGNGKVAVVTPALAFDAGFTLAYGDRAATKGAADAGQLKALAEACLAQHQDVGTCFSVGYVYGAQAVAGGLTAAR